MDSARHGNSLRARLLVIEGLMWTVALIIAWWGTLNVTGEQLRQVIMFSSALSVIAGIRFFLGHGRLLITATGLFSLSAAMFIGYAGFELGGRDDLSSRWEYIALAVVIGITAQLGTTLLAWRRLRTTHVRSSWFSTRDSNWVAWAGVVTLILATAVRLMIPAWRQWAEATAFTGICLLAAGLVLRENTRFFSWGTMLVGGLLVLYSEFFHSGTGRLRLVALACAVAIIYCVRFQRARLKFAIVVMIPIALEWLARDRLELQESLATGASEGRSGLESMIAPLNVFSLLLRSFREQGFSPEYGYNLLSVPALFIPESIWPDQPRALGYELVFFYAPERYSPDGIYSTVASWVGEAIFNFGWWGVPIIIVAAACGLRFLDGMLVHRLEGSRANVLGILSIVFVVILTGAVADYTWSGLHTYAARTLSRLPAFFLVLVFAWIHLKITDTDRPKNRRRDSLLRNPE